MLRAVVKAVPEALNDHRSLPASMVKVKCTDMLLTTKRCSIHGLRKGLGTDEDENAKENTVFLSAMDLMGRGEVLGHARLVGVRVKWEYHSCIALACNDPLDPLPMARRDMIETLKKVLHTEQEPRWYKYAGA
jgi:hypothetical protein